MKKLRSPDGNSGFTDPTQEQTRHGNPQLYTREITIQVLKYFFCYEGSFLALFDLYLELRQTYLYERELTSYKECIESDKHENNQCAQKRGKSGVRVHICIV